MVPFGGGVGGEKSPIGHLGGTLGSSRCPPDAPRLQNEGTWCPKASKITLPGAPWPQKGARQVPRGLKKWAPRLQHCSKSVQKCERSALSFRLLEGATQVRFVAQYTNLGKMFLKMGGLPLSGYYAWICTNYGWISRQGKITGFPSKDGNGESLYREFS